jgi:hypothetical protein
MSRKPTSKRTRPKPKAVLRLPDLDQAKSAVLNSLTSGDAQRGYSLSGHLTSGACVVSAKPAMHESRPGRGCSTLPPVAEASLFLCASFADRI